MRTEHTRPHENISLISAILWISINCHTIRLTISFAYGLYVTHAIDDLRVSIPVLRIWTDHQQFGACVCLSALRRVAVMPLSSSFSPCISLLLEVHGYRIDFFSFRCVTKESLTEYLFVSLGWSLRFFVRKKKCDSTRCDRSFSGERLECTAHTHTFSIELNQHRIYSKDERRLEMITK